MKSVYLLIACITLVSCGYRNTKKLQEKIELSNIETVEYVFSQDSIDNYFKLYKIDSKNVLNIDESLIGVATSFIPMSFCLNEEGKVIHKRPCNADFPNYLEKNYGSLVKNTLITRNVAIEKIEAFIESQQIQLNEFSVLYFVSPKMQRVKPTLESQLLPLISECENYPNVSVIIVFADHYEGLGLSEKEYYNLKIKNNYQTLLDFDAMPENWRELYILDSLILKEYY